MTKDTGPIAGLDSIRPITDDDLPAVTDLMVASFPRRDHAYFQQGFERLSQRAVPEGGQKYGYVIDDGGIKGAVLSISSEHHYPETSQVFTNISTWCVAPSHRGPLAKALYDRAGGPDDQVTANLSAAKHTLRTLDKLNFRPVTNGQVLAIASRRGSKPARMVSLDAAISRGLDATHARTLADHQARGCVVGCMEAEGSLSPLVFLPRRMKKVLTAGQLIYCQDVAHLLAHIGPVLPWLRRHGKMALIMDANGPLPQLMGRYMPGKAAKFIRGADPIWDVDHTYSEVYYLGF